MIACLVFWRFRGEEYWFCCLFHSMVSEVWLVRWLPLCVVQKELLSSRQKENIERLFAKPNPQAPVPKWWVNSKKKKKKRMWVGLGSCHTVFTGMLMCKDGKFLLNLSWGRLTTFTAEWTFVWVCVEFLAIWSLFLSLCQSSSSFSSVMKGEKQTDTFDLLNKPLAQRGCSRSSSSMCTSMTYTLLLLTICVQQ